MHQMRSLSSLLLRYSLCRRLHHQTLRHNFVLEAITYRNMWGLEYILPFGSKDRFLAFRKVRGSSVSSLGGGGWLMTVILAISVLNRFAIVWLAATFPAGNRLMYHLSASQMTIVDVQMLLKCLVAIRLTNFRTLGTRLILHKQLIHQRKFTTLCSLCFLNCRCRVQI